MRRKRIDWDEEIRKTEQVRRIEPEFCRCSVTTNVDARRFIPLRRVEEEFVRADVGIDFSLLNWLHVNVLCAWNWKEKGAPKKRRVVATKLFYHEEAPDNYGGSLELCMTWK